jgi:DNA repair protein RadA/Sms
VERLGQLTELARIAEAEKLGFEKIIVSKYNLLNHSTTRNQVSAKGNQGKKFNIEIISISKVEELYKYLF